jgi:antirestriction protein ArdC
MTFATKPEKGERTREAVAKLEAGIARLAAEADWRRYLDTQRRFHRYSFNNVLLIGLQKPEATQVAGFHTWLSMGRAVRKGEKGIWILAPRTRREEDDETGDKRTIVTGFHAVPAFDVSQTDGEPLAAPEGPRLLEGDGVDGAYEALELVARSIGYTVAAVEPAQLENRQANGECQSSTRQIRISDEIGPAQRIKTLAHELGHALMHGDRDRPATRELIELEAESVAYVVTEAIGLDASGYSWAYVLGWAGGGEEAIKGIRESGNRIQKASAFILDALADQADRRN